MEYCKFSIQGQNNHSIIFFWSVFKIAEEERKLEAAIEETEKQNIGVNAELKEMELKSNRFKVLEDRLVSSPCNVW